MDWDGKDDREEEWDGELEDRVAEFFRKYPTDERIQGYLTSGPAYVARRVLRDFKPRSEGEQDYSGLIASFQKKVRAELGLPPLAPGPGGGGGGGGGGGWGGGGKGGGKGKGGGGAMPGDWVCPGCNFLNFARNDACRQCSTPRPRPQQVVVAMPTVQVQAVPVAPSLPGALPGDWICPNCNDLQFARNQSCRQCGTMRPAEKGVWAPVAPVVAKVAAAPDQAARDADAFNQRYPVDDDTYDFLLDSSREVQLRVIREFKPARAGERDYSTLMMAYIKKCRADEEFELLQGGGAPSARSAQPPPRQLTPRGPQGGGGGGGGGGPYAGEMFQVPCRFFQRGDCHRGAACPYQHTAPGGAGPAAPSAGQGVWGGPIKARGSRSDGGSVEAFLAKYPVDGRAREFLLAASPEVRSQVIQEFRPRVEGEADYSGLLMAFTRRCLGDSRPPPRGAAAPAPATIPAYPSSRGDARWADRREAPWATPAAAPGREASADGGHRRPTESAASGPGKEGCEAFRERFPMDDRAYEFLSSSSAEVCQKVISTFSPRRPNDSDFSPAVMAYTRACRKEMGDDGPLQFAAGGGGGAASGANIDIEELDRATDAFFDRYPCDNRCVAFLKALEPEVCDRVLREFIPRREGDSDYSAIVMSFAKSCMDWGQPASRAHLGRPAESHAAGQPAFKRQRNYN